MQLRNLLLSSLVCLTLATNVQAENWPQFRGAEYNAVTESSFPQEWSAEKNVKWKFKNPGEGWSSPIVWGNRLFLTSAEMIEAPRRAAEEYREEAGETTQRQRPSRDSSAQPPERGQRPPRGEGGGRGGQRGGRGGGLTTARYRWVTSCLDTNTGEELWRQVAREGNPPQGRHGQNTYATETPVTDGEFVYVYFGMNGLYCYTLDGKLAWNKDLGNYEMRAGWGTSSSPVLYQGKLYLQIDNEQQSFLVALDGKTGEEVWRVNRDEPSQYSSPIIWKNSQRAELITGGQFTRSYAPETGELLWELNMFRGRSSATPVAQGDVLFVGNELRNQGGSDTGGGFLYAVKAGASGQITPEEGESTSSGVLWSRPKAGMQMASPVVCEGHIYLLERRAGVLHCINAESGQLAYQTRIPGGQAFWASPWVYQDKVFCLDETGSTHIIQGGPEFRVLGVNSLPEQFWASAAIADGKLFLRGTEYLYCIAE